MKRTLIVSVLSLVSTFFCSAFDISLNGHWELSFWQQPDEPVTSPEGMSWQDVKTIHATVPGNVDIDLVAAGLEADSRADSNNALTRKWEGWQWCYTKTFIAPMPEPGRKYQLWFGGIDTIADVWLNGEHLGRTENMLIEHSFDVTKVLRPGENKIQVIIQSAVLYGRKQFLESTNFGNPASPESVNIRKAPHMFGWDGFPRLVSAGLWRGVELRTIEPVHFRDVYWMTANVDLAAGTAELYADTQFEMPASQYDKTRAVWTLSRNGKVVSRSSQPCISYALRQKINLEDVDFWWPRGYGEPALYDAKCELISDDGHVLAVDEQKIGIRTVKPDFNDDDPDRFRLIINDEPISVRDTNWGPLDALHSRDAKRVDETVKHCADLNCNMIHCWGGNVYEDHRFFDLCDEYGIMVWQDFIFSGNAYTQDDQFGKIIWDEAKSVIIKLRRHPSLALWSGDDGRDGLLSRAVSCFDPLRTFIPVEAHCLDVK